jgi:glycosyltransferase involved in cell wall biosynthesis
MARLLADSPLAKDVPLEGVSAVPCPPKLIINGRFLVQQATGVQRVAREITLEIDRMLERGELIADILLLVPPGGWVQDLSLKRVRVETVGAFGGFWWEQIILPQHVGGARLLCLGNSAPIFTLVAANAQATVMIHDVSFLDHPFAYKFAYRQAHRLMLPFVLRRARHILTVSQTERERLLQIDPSIAPKITVAPNGGWTAREPASASNVPFPVSRYALYVGSLSHRKNFDRILAAAIITAREDGLDFVFVGSTAKILNRPAVKVPHDVAGKIHFLGQINDGARLAQIYKAAQMLVFPSLYEACPLPPVEAMHFGCPVVVSNIPSMWERCGREVTYCNPLSVDSIVRAMRVLMAQDQAGSAIKSRAGRVAMSTWAGQAARICKCVLVDAYCSAAPKLALAATYGQAA